MSMEISSADMRQYIYNPAELRGELKAKGLQSAQIEGILRELDSGSIDTLKSLGLSGSVASSGAADLEAVAIDLPAVATSHAKVSSINIMDVMLLLNETAEKLREANREVKLTEGVSGMQESLAAADRMRSAAFTTLCIGIGAGAVSLAGSGTSLYAAVKQTVGATASARQLAPAQKDARQLQNEQQLGQSQVKLKQANDKVDRINQRTATIDDELGTAGLPESRRNSLGAERRALTNDKTKLETETIPGLKSDIEKQAKTVANPHEKQLQSLDRQIAAQGKVVDKTTDGAALATERNKLNSLMKQRTDLNNTADVTYRNPTSEANLNGAQAYVNTRTERLSPAGDVGSRLNEAKGEFKLAVDALQGKFGWTMGLSAVTMQSSQLVNAFNQYRGTTGQAAMQEGQVSIQKHQMFASEAKDYMDNAADTMKDALSTMKECLQSQNQARQAIYQNM